jgi:SPP1 family predicted phage head-tail adaptor
MPAGKYDKRIVIQQRATGRNSSGGMVAAWQQFAERWAGVNNLSGNEKSATAHQGGETAVARTVFTLRYLAGVDETMRVLYGGKAFNIRFVNDVYEQHKTLILTCDTGATEGL